MRKITLMASLFVLAFNLPSEAQSLKGDPWIFQAYSELYGKQPTAWELNINNYNSGSWNNYGELKSYIKEYQASLGKYGLSVLTKKLDDSRVAAGFVRDGKLVAVDLVSTNGGKVVASGGGNVVASGGGNLTFGAASLQISSATLGVNFRGKYTTQSAGTTVIPVSGKGALIIR